MPTRPELSAKIARIILEKLAEEPGGVRLAVL